MNEFKFDATKGDDDDDDDDEEKKGTRVDGRRERKKKKREGKERDGRVYLFYSSSKETSASTERKVSERSLPTVSSTMRTWRQRHGHGEWIRVIENHWSFKLATRRCHYRVDLPLPSPTTPALPRFTSHSPPPRPTEPLFILFSRMPPLSLSLSLSTAPSCRPASSPPPASFLFSHVGLDTRRLFLRFARSARAPRVLNYTDSAT